MGSPEERLAALEARVADLADREAIRELTAAYCRSIVRADGPGVVELFTEDGSLVTHFPEGSGQEDIATRGHAALREAYANLEPGDTMPFIQNHIVEVDGDEARGTCSVEIRMRQAGAAITGAGHYHDRYRRVQGRWRFASRELFVYHWVPLSQGWA